MKVLVKKEKLTEEKGKRKILIRLLAAGIFFILASIAFFLWIRIENDKNQIDMPPDIGNLGEGIVTASGLTAVGMLDEAWNLDFLQTKLYVEESYLSVGDEVEKGTAVFKVSDKTLQEARKELEDAVTEAELAYRQGLIDYEAGVIDARVTKENAEINKKYSQAQYDSAVAEAAWNVKEIERQVEEARELADEYTKSVNEDYYRAYYKIDELNQAYYEHFSLLMEIYKKWDIENKENSQEPGNGSMLSNEGNDMSEGFVQKEDMSGGTMKAGYNEGETLLSVYNLLDEMVKQEAEEYETALENYEKAKRTAQAGLEKAKSDLASLEAELVTAQTKYEKQLITCKADYEITLAESDNAQAVYEASLESLKETLTSLENKKEEAQENLAFFEKVIGDGYFYTQSAGTIVMNGVRKGSYLSEESLLIAYSNPEKVSVSASVDQSDIARIAIGDIVYVVISEYGSYQGKVTMINPVTQARSQSSVTYQVTVTLEGDVSTLDSNLTSYVYFGMSDEMIQEMQNMPQNGGSNPAGENGGVPGREDMPQGGNNPFPENRRKEGGQ